jgi:spore coat protein U-like protein
MKIGTFAAGLALASTLACGSLAFGQSVSVGGTVTLIYDPLSEKVESVLVTSRMPDNHPVLDYYLTVDTALAKRYFGSATQKIEYQIYDSDTPGSRNIVMSFKEASSAADVLSGVFSGNTAVREAVSQLFFTVTPSPDAFMAAGTYPASVPISLWSGTFRVKKSEATGNLTANLVVNEILKLSVVADGAPYGSTELNTFDLGTLSGTVEFRADLYALANTAYKVTVKSANGGVLKFTDENFVDSNTVDYALYVGTSSAEIPLAANTPAPIASSTLGTGRRGKKYDLRIVVPDFSLNEVMPWAGLYTDTLTVTIAKN